LQNVLVFLHYLLSVLEVATAGSRRTGCAEVEVCLFHEPLMS
jgi:hypothetical protein